MVSSAILATTATSNVETTPENLPLLSIVPELRLNHTTHGTLQLWWKGMEGVQTICYNITLEESLTHAKSIGVPQKCSQFLFLNRSVFIITFPPCSFLEKIDSVFLILQISIYAEAELQPPTRGAWEKIGCQKYSDFS